MAKKKKRARSRAHQNGKQKSRKGLSQKRARTSRKVPPARRSRKSKAFTRKRKEFLRRSKASKKGWRRRKAKERIAEKVKQKPKSKKGPLREYVVNFGLRSKGKLRERSVTAIARSEEEAIHSVYRAIHEGEDSMGADLAWMEPLDWEEVTATRAPEGEELDAQEIREQGAGWTEVH